VLLREGPRRRANPRGWIAILFCTVAGTLAVDGAARKSPVAADCSVNGHALYGRIQIVDAFPDVKVQRVKHFEDLRVQLVSAFADRCGRWQLVAHHADTKVQWVEQFADVKIRYVESFPGVP